MTAFSTPVGPVSVNVVALMFVTASLNVTLMLERTLMFVPPLAGVVVDT
jgi:hypothetical protein